MEKEDKDILQKIRSSRACIRDGYRMFTERFRRIFRHTWKWAIGFAVLSAVASALPVLVSPTLTLAGLLIEVVAVAAVDHDRVSRHHIDTHTVHLVALSHHDGCQLGIADGCDQR